MPSKIQIHTDRAPKPVGPYSQGIIYGDQVFTVQIGLDPAMDKIVGPDIESQTLQNIAAILEAGGTSLAGALKVTVFLANLDDFDRMNRVYAGFFPTDPPARATIEAKRLPLDVLVEIECIAGR